MPSMANESLPWRDAACLSPEIDPELFFPVDADRTHAGQAQIAAAKVVCATCPERLRLACLRAAMTSNEQGVWGGTSETERVQLRELLQARRQRGRRVVAA